MRLHLIRHGHAGSRSDFDGPDEQRPLTGRGFREATAIAQALADAGVDTVWSSRYLRCRQTVEPLAEAAGTTVVDHPAFCEGEPGGAALDALLAAAEEGRVVAACSHGDVIPLLVDVACRRGARLEGPPSPAKGARYVLHVEDGRVTRIVHVDRPAT